MLGGNPTPAAPAATNLLYAGEQFDLDLQNYYLRARYYNPLTGLFNRMDPFSGNRQDPQSLHKYLYCHANPANEIDPTGKMTLLNVMATAARIGRLFIKYWPVVRAGLIIADVLNATAIVIKIITEGPASVTAGEWAEFGLILTTALFGGKAARAVAKALIRRALRIPISALGSFKFFKRFVQAQNVIVEASDLQVIGRSGSIIRGQFELIEQAGRTRPIIYLYRDGRNIRSLLHEFVHFAQWRLFGQGMSRQTWKAFLITNNNAIKLEKVAYFVEEIFT
jgi:RHS repeat-associated protein